MKFVMVQNQYLAFSIVAATIDNLISNYCSFIFATHLHELTKN